MLLIQIGVVVLISVMHALTCIVLPSFPLLLFDFDYCYATGIK